MKNWKVCTNGYHYPHLHIVEQIDEHHHKTVAVIPRGMAENREENMRKAQILAASTKFLELNKKLLKQIINYEDATGVMVEIRRLIEKVEGDDS